MHAPRSPKTGNIDGQSNRWVLWTPKGYYAASQGGEDLIGWHVNRSWDTVADFFSASRFREQFYRPDIVTRILDDLDEETAIVRADEQARRNRQQEEIRRNLPPVLRIVSPATDTPFASDEIKVEYAVRSPSGLMVKRVFALIDGRPIDAATSNVIASGDVEATGSLNVKLPPRNVKVSLVAETERNESEAATIDLLRSNISGQPSGPKPTLFALIIGVGTYANPAWNVEFASRDADAFADQLLKQKDFAFLGSQHREDDQREATETGVRRGLTWLKNQVQDDSAIALVYFSGHGLTTADGESYLLAHDYNGQVTENGSISKHWLKGVLRGLPSKVLLVLDACHAAAGIDVAGIRGAHRLDTVGLMNEFGDASNGIISIVSSKGTERSYGDKSLGHSYFTHALLEGLSGKATYRARPKSRLSISSGGLYGGLISSQAVDKHQPSTNHPLMNHVRLAVVH